GQKEQNDHALADLNQALGLGLEILNWDFEAAKGIMPINLYHERALVYQRLGNPEAALKNMNRAIALSKQQPNKGGLGIDYMRRSEIYYSLGRLDEAATDARRALGLFQGLSSAYKILGLVALNQEDLSQAVTYFDKALESLGEQKGWPYSEAQFGKAAVFWIQGQRSRAWDTLKTALQQTQGDAHVYFFLGFMAHSNSDTAQARAYFARAQELIPDVYQVRSEILASEKSDRWTQLRQEMVRVAGSYYGAGAEPIPQQRPVARLEIQQVRVVPNPVPAGAPFDIETTYRVSDSASREATLALLYRCEIYQGQQRLFGSKELSIQGQNGAEKTWVQHMNPVTLQGAFRVKTYLRYQGEEAVAAGDFRIQ
ncbi:MAG: tetratricopeptide repeat protein, partial [Desulfuromonadaceae bacterium]